MRGARIGVIGLGEAGTVFGEGLIVAGAESVCGFDTCPDAARRAGQAGVTPVGSLRELAERSNAVICLTTARSAMRVAEEIRPYLTPEHVYGDWNSAAPAVKVRIGEVLGGTGARFADGAVMAAVRPPLADVPVLLSGPGAEPMRSAVVGYGMRVEVLGDEPGQASAVKMFRSLLVKGLEALIVEALAGAVRYGVGERVLESMNVGVDLRDWPALGAYLVGRSVRHGERRAEELRQVAATLADSGTEPMLAVAGAHRLQWFADRVAAVRSGDGADPGVSEILNWLDNRGGR